MNWTLRNNLCIVWFENVAFLPNVYLHLQKSSVKLLIKRWEVKFQADSKKWSKIFDIGIFYTRIYFSCWWSILSGSHTILFNVHCRCETFASDWAIRETCLCFLADSNDWTKSVNFQKYLCLRLEKNPVYFIMKIVRMQPVFRLGFMYCIFIVANDSKTIQIYIYNFPRNIQWARTSTQVN